MILDAQKSCKDSTNGSHLLRAIHGDIYVTMLRLSKPRNSSCIRNSRLYEGLSVFPLRSFLGPVQETAFSWCVLLVTVSSTLPCFSWPPWFEDYWSSNFLTSYPLIWGYGMFSSRFDMGYGVWERLPQRCPLSSRHNRGHVPATGLSPVALTLITSVKAVISRFSRCKSMPHTQPFVFVGWVSR